MGSTTVTSTDPTISDYTVSQADNTTEANYTVNSSEDSTSGFTINSGYNTTTYIPYYDTTQVTDGTTINGTESPGGFPIGN